MKSGKRIIAVKVLRKDRNTYRLLQAVGQNLTEWRKGLCSRLKDLPLAALRPADLGNASKNSFACHVFGKLSYTALTLLLPPPPFYWTSSYILRRLFPKDVVGILFNNLLQSCRIWERPGSSAYHTSVVTSIINSSDGEIFQAEKIEAAFQPEPLCSLLNTSEQLFAALTQFLCCAVIFSVWTRKA
jgi:hypothetical protein